MRAMIGGILWACVCAVQSTSAVTNFTEGFEASAENWRTTDGVTALTWIDTGGPDGVGDAFVRAEDLNLDSVAMGGTVIFARGHASYGSSGGAFVGNWLSNEVVVLSFDLRHTLDMPVSVGVRITSPRNYPASFAATPIAVPPNEWVTVVIPIHPDNPGFISHEGGSFEATFASVGNLQLAFMVPEELTDAAGPYSVDIDNVSIRCAGESEGVTAEWIEPTYDRWMYPFNPSPGKRPTASTFATVNEPDFDERDGHAYFAFILTNAVPAGLGANTYEVTSARLRVTVQDGEFLYDPTPDPWQTYLSNNAPLYMEDNTPGRPVELFGAGYRAGFTAWTFGEDGPFSAGNPMAKGVRNVYPLGYRDGVPVDVSNNVDFQEDGADGFDPVVFAIGTAPLTPGDWVPWPTTFVFDIDVQNALVQGYLREALNEGILPLVLASRHPTTQGGAIEYPIWDQKENEVGTPASLEINYTVKLALSLTHVQEAMRIQWPTITGEAGAWIEGTSDIREGNWTPWTGYISRTNGHSSFTLPNNRDASWFIRLVKP